MKDIAGRLDVDALRALVRAKCVSKEFNLNALYAEALVIGILATGPNDASYILMDSHVDGGAIMRECVASLKSRAGKKTPEPSTNLIYGTDAEVKAALKLAEELRQSDGVVSISTFQLMVALMRSSRSVRQIFKRLGITTSVDPRSDFMLAVNTRRDVPPSTVHPTTFHLQNGDACWCWRNRFGPPGEAQQQN